MKDVINLLPDAVANQIAAGEVVQRPASVVKELLENALDAKANKITLSIREGGNTFIQVTDNGLGMTDTDARMCWERHATSKIKKAEDIFSIFSYGFRGEAMASIAAVAQVEMKTMREEASLGSYIRIEGSKLIEQKSTAAVPGTQTTVRNLFYNVPARRNFLKSVSVETKHVFEEFYRVALARPEVGFQLYNNDKEVYDLEAGSLQERIEELFAKNQSDKLLSVEEATDIVGISGFVGTPDLAKKTRGEQYLFVNDRFIKNAYFNHAILGAYENLIEQGRFPFYVLKLRIKPEKIDVNIHPTKTEVKFEDDRFIYRLVQSSVKQALGKYSAVPDFSQLTTEFLDLSTETVPDSQNMMKTKLPRYSPVPTAHERRNLKNWEKLVGEVPKDPPLVKQARELLEQREFIAKPEVEVPSALFQLANAFIVAKQGHNLLLIDQKRAHERVLYERFDKGIEQGGLGTQTLLFPKTIQFSDADFHLLMELEEDIKQLGFDFAVFGKDTIILNGVPAGQGKGLESDLIEGLLEQYKFNKKQPGLKARESMLLSLSGNLATRRGTALTNMEISELIKDLYHSTSPGICPRGKAISVKLTTEQLNQMLQIK